MNFNVEFYAPVSECKLFVPESVLIQIHNSHHTVANSILGDPKKVELRLSAQTGVWKYCLRGQLAMGG